MITCRVSAALGVVALLGLLGRTPIGAEEPARNLPGFQNLLPADEPLDESLLSLVESNNRFAIDLYGQLKDQPGNLFFSPYSISSALAMAYAGARGETAAQMAETLHFDLPENELHSALGRLRDRWEDKAGPATYRINIANSIWVQQGEPILPEFLSVVQADHEATLRVVDFVARSGEVRAEMNAWVAEQTQGKIRNMIPPRQPARDTQLMLINAVYFHGKWAKTFERRRTRREPFKLSTGRIIRVPLMVLKKPFRYSEQDDVQVVELPYKGDAVSMLVLLPKTHDGLDELEGRFTNEWLARVIENFEQRQVLLWLPRFSTESQYELTTPLTALGMTDAFQRPQADFSGINGRPDYRLTAVTHKAFVDVNEEGTEAAAATKGGFGVGGIERRLPPVEFKADRPFIYLIRHNFSGSILFLGRLSDPTN